MDAVDSKQRSASSDRLKSKLSIAEEPENVQENNTISTSSASASSHETAKPSLLTLEPRRSMMDQPPGENEYDVLFHQTGALGLYFEFHGTKLCVTRFPRGPSNEQQPAEQCGQIQLFDEIHSANGYPLHHYSVDRAAQMIQAQSRPLTVRFTRSNKVQQLLGMGFSTASIIKGLHLHKGNLSAAANYCSECA